MSEQETLAQASEQEAPTAAGTLSPTDLTTLAELGNITMGAAVSALAATLNMELELLPPEPNTYVTYAEMPDPFSGSERILSAVSFTQGLNAASAYLMKTEEAQYLADMMLGGASQKGPEPITDLQISALGEAMSQMMNAAATNLGSILSEAIEINNPEVSVYSDEAINKALPGLAEGGVATVLYQLKMGDRTLAMLQVMTIGDAQAQISKMMSLQPGGADGVDMSAVAGDTSALDAILPQAGLPPKEATMTGGGSVSVKPVQFGAFDEQVSIAGELNKNLELVMDVTLNLTVELGKTELSIKEVLELTRGSVLDLDRIAGEPVDLFANGKLIAKAEVIVIEDNFGVRITSIVSPAERLRGL